MKSLGLCFLRVCCIGLPLLHLSASNAAAAEPRALKSVLSPLGYRPVEMHFVPNEDLLWIDAMINGRSARLAVGTAAPVTALDRAATARLGFRELPSQMPVKGTLGTSKEKFGFLRRNSIEVANIVIVENSFAVLDQQQSLGANALGAGVIGTFGGADLQRLGAVIDCGDGVLYLNPGGTSKPSTAALAAALAARGFARIPLQENMRRHLEAKFRFNGHGSRMTIETWAVTSISTRTAKKAGIRSSASGTVLEAAGGMKAAAARGHVENLSAGPFSTRGTPVFIAADVKFDVLGLDFLREHSE